MFRNALALASMTVGAAKENTEIMIKHTQNIGIAEPAKKKALTSIGLGVGAKRWLFGLEPDWSYRLRLLKIMNPNVDGRGK